MKITFLHNGYESLAIEALSAALKKGGFETSLVIDPLLFDEPGFWRIKPLARAFDLRREVMRRLKADKPGLVCFSVFTDTCRWALSWAQEVKRFLGVPVVFGGIHPTSAPERVIAEDCVDFVCVGEGDRALPELAAALAAGRDLSVPNIWRKKNGAVLKGPPAAPENLDSLEFPDKEIFYGRYPFFARSYLASASRGCPYACAYCCNSVYGKLYGGRYYRKRRPETVIKELEDAAARRRPEFVHFTDEVFNADKAWLGSFLPLYRSRIGLPFSCYAFPDLLDEETAAGMKKAGCFKVQIGVQRFDEEKRAALLDRRSSNAGIAAAIKALKKAGIYVACDNMLGLPQESAAELDCLLRFYAENTPDANEVFFLKYYPGTALTARALDEGRPNLEEPEKNEKGLEQSGIIKAAGEDGALALKKYFTALLILPLLPGPLRALLLRRRLYLSLPDIGNIFLRILTRLLGAPERDFHTAQFIRRHIYFMPRRFRFWRTENKN